MGRKEDVEKFVEEVNRLEQEFKIKIVADNPNQELMYLDEQERKLYHKEDGSIKEW